MHIPFSSKPRDEHFHMFVSLLSLAVICVIKTTCIISLVLKCCFSTQVVSHSNYTLGTMANSMGNLVKSLLGSPTYACCMHFSVHSTIIITDVLINQVASYYQITNYTLYGIEVNYLPLLVLYCCYYTQLGPSLLCQVSKSIENNASIIGKILEQSL